MSKISSIITRNRDDVLACASRAKTYISSMSLILTKKDQKLVHAAQNVPREIFDYVTNLPIPNDFESQSLEVLNELYEKEYSMIQMLAPLVKLVKLEIRDSELFGTGTSLLYNHHVEKNIIINHYNTIAARLRDIARKLTTIMMPVIKDQAQIPELLKYIESVNYNDFIADVTNQLYTYHKEKYGPYVLLFVNKLLDKTLDATRRPAQTNVVSASTRCHLAPVIESRKLSDIALEPGLDFLSKINLSDHKDGESFIAKVRELHQKTPEPRVSILLLYRPCKSPIEFNFAPKISLEYLTDNNLIEKSTAGITKKFIKRSETIKELDMPTVPTSASISQLRGTIDLWYVLDTLNGIVFRFLTPFAKLYDHKLSHTDTNIAKYTIPEPELYSILVGQSTRLDEYNRVMEQQIITRYYNEGAKTITEDFERIKENADPLAMVREIRNAYDNLYQRARPKFKGPEDLISFLRDTKQAYSIILPLMKKTETDIESTLTSYSKIYTISDDMAKDINYAIDSSGIKNNIGLVKNVNEMRELFDGYYDIILTKALNCTRLRESFILFGKSIKSVAYEYASKHFEF